MPGSEKGEDTQFLCGFLLRAEQGARAATPGQELKRINVGQEGLCRGEAGKGTR